MKPGPINVGCLTYPDPESLYDVVLNQEPESVETQCTGRADLETALRQAQVTIASDNLMIYGEMNQCRSGAEPNSWTRPDLLSATGDWLGQEMRESA